MFETYMYKWCHKWGLDNTVLAVIAVLLLCTWLLAPHIWSAQPKLAQLAAAQPWLWAYATNIAVSRGMPVPLVAHFWSLAVEEQFYFLWPIAIFAIPKRAVAPTALALIVAALLIRLGLTRAGWSDAAIYVLTPCRMDSLAAGALAAVLLRDHKFGPKRLAALAIFFFSLCGTALAIAMLVLPLSRVGRLDWSSLPQGSGIFSPHAMVVLEFHYSGYPRDMLMTVLSVFFVSLLILSISPSALWSLPNRVFSWAPLRIVGGYSYGLYVFHFIVERTITMLLNATHYAPLIYGSGVGDIAVIAVNLSITSSLAFVSYHVLEKRLLALKRNFPEVVRAAPKPVPLPGAVPPVR